MKTRHVGYGLMADGKPSGIWPIPLWLASRNFRRLSGESQEKRYTIVSIHIGDDVAPSAEEPSSVTPEPNNG